MRSVLVLLGAAAFALGTAACGGAVDDDSEQSTKCTVEKVSEPLTPAYVTVEAMHGFSNEEIYVVGSKFHKYGVTSGWQEIEGIEDAYYADIWGSSPSDIFLVGVPGIHHYDGSKVEAMEHPQYEEVTAVWGTAPDNVWAAGLGGDGYDLLRYDGHEWTVVQHFGLGEGCLVHNIWGLDQNDVWAVGACLLHFDGSSWAQPDLEFWGTISGIWGTAPDDIWLVGHTATEGNDTLIMHWDSTALETVMDEYPYYDEESNVGSSYALKDISGHGPTSVYSVGHCAAYFNGTDWTIIPRTGGIGVFVEDSKNALMINGYGTVRRLSCQ